MCGLLSQERDDEKSTFRSGVAASCLSVCELNKSECKSKATTPQYFYDPGSLLQCLSLSVFHCKIGMVIFSSEGFWEG